MYAESSISTRPRLGRTVYYELYPASNWVPGLRHRWRVRKDRVWVGGTGSVKNMTFLTRKEIQSMIIQ